jgi:hypothetical protein
VCPRSYAFVLRTRLIFELYGVHVHENPISLLLALLTRQIDLSKLSVNNHSIYNIHRPFRDECVRAIVNFPDALFYINHYIGSYERYDSRTDARRSRSEWEKRAYLDEGTTCETGLYTWFPRFLSLVESRAGALLGVI